MFGKACWARLDLLAGLAIGSVLLCWFFIVMICIVFIAWGVGVPFLVFVSKRLGSCAVVLLYIF